MVGAASSNWVSTSWHVVYEASVSASPSVWTFLNSTFVAGLAAAFAGALGGALAAAWATTRNARLEAAVGDIRNLNAGVTIANGVIGAMVGLKRQFVMPMAAEYQALVDRHSDYAAKVARMGSKNVEPFHFNPDVRLVDPPRTEIAELASFMVKNAGVDPAGWTVFNTLRQILANLELMLSQRNAILEEMRTTPPEARDKVVAIYLGLSTSDGFIDARHQQLMEALPGQVDDALGFARVLTEHLTDRAKSIASQFGRRKKPLVARADLSRWADVFPDMAEYYAMLNTVKGVAGELAGS